MRVDSGDSQTDGKYTIWMIVEATIRNYVAKRIINY